jgi:hypothetical protein
LRSLKEQAPELPTTTLFADSAYADSGLREQLPRTRRQLVHAEEETKS